MIIEEKISWVKLIILFIGSIIILLACFIGYRIDVARPREVDPVPVDLYTENCTIYTGDTVLEFTNLRYRWLEVYRDNEYSVDSITGLLELRSGQRDYRSYSFSCSRIG